MGGNSEQFEDRVPAMTAGSSGIVEEAGDSGDPLASIGYEAADPSFFSPQWRETLQGLPRKRELR